MAVAELKAKLGMDDSEFSRVIRQSVATANKAGKDMSSAFSGIGASLAGAFGGAAIIGLARNALETASGIQDMSDALNISTDSLQQFSFAFSQSGGSQEAFVKGLTAINAKLEEARDGNDATIATFAKLGVSIDDLRNPAFDGEKALLKFADAFKQGGTNAEQMAAFGDMVGAKIQNKMLPALKDGSAAFLEMAKSAAIMSQQTIAALDATQDRIDGGWKKVITFAGTRLAAGVEQMQSASDSKYNESGIVTGLYGVLTGGGSQANAKKVTHHRGEKAQEKLDIATKSETESKKAAAKELVEAAKEQDDFAKQQFALAEKYRGIEEDIANIQKQSAFNAMDDEHKKLALVRERAAVEKEIQARLNGFNPTGGDAVEGLLNAQRRKARLDAEIGTDTKKAPAAGRSGSVSAKTWDAMKWAGFKNASLTSGLGDYGHVQGATGGLDSGGGMGAAYHVVKRGDHARAKAQQKEAARQAAEAKQKAAQEYAPVIEAINQPTWTKGTK